METTHRDPGTGLLDLLLACHRAAKEVAEHTGLSSDEVFCLFILQEHRPQNVKALSNLLGVRSSRMSKILYSLEDRGFVVRAISLVDHRMEEVTLTPRGKDRIVDVLAFARTLADDPPFAGGHLSSGISVSATGQGRRSHSRSHPLDQEHH